MPRTKKSVKAARLGDQILSDGAKNPLLLNNFAWAILTDPRITARDLGLALRAAKKSYDTNKGEEPGFTDTYARALFDTGKISEAIEIQKEAIRTCKDERQRSAFEQTLEGYRKKTSERAE